VFAGVVLDYETRRPLSEATVKVLVTESDTGEEIEQAYRTGPDGRFEFEVTDADVLLGLNARRNGYCPLEYDQESLDSPVSSEILLGVDSLVTFNGWARLDSVKVNCDGVHPDLYNYDCELEDREVFQRVEGIVFYFSVKYNLTYGDPKAISRLGARLRLPIVNDREIEYQTWGIGSHGTLLDGRVFSWYFGIDDELRSIGMMAFLTGDEMQHYVETGIHIDDLDLRIWSTYSGEACVDEFKPINRDGVPIAFELEDGR
jgi:hypothetical protein